MIENGLMLWILFSSVIAAMLYIDLGVVNRHAHVVSIKEALLWSGVWIAIALLFNLGLYFWRGKEPALEFLTGYLIEKSLSVDNLFVFLLIFSYFRVPAQYQHQVLFWGIFGALVMRFLFIFAGVALIKQFHWIIYVFGGFLILTGIKLALEKDKEVHPEKNPVLKLFRRFMPMTDRYDGGRFFIREAGRLLATPLFVVLLVVETTDVIFAVDSIPAIFGITLDPFIVYSSNAFAILGLRALYFALAGLMRLFTHLHYGLSAILVFVGVKMLIADLYKIPIGTALGVVAGILALSILVSILFKPVAEAPNQRRQPGGPA
ncbi:MAG: TerC family protein [Candidatus Omnitrophota bacterium]|nr:TerC family protein [Candidatus Omnitrophota bacterium]